MKLRNVVLAVPAVVLLATAASADRETAEYFTSRGQRYLEDKDWERALEMFQRALEEDPTYLPAAYHLGEAHLGAGEREKGIERLRAFVDDAAESTEWSDLVATARERLEEVDVAGGELHAIVRDYADRLTELAAKYWQEDPQIAETALRRVLELRPGDAKAAALLERMGKEVTPIVHLFNGKNCEGWVKMFAPDWQCIGGILTAFGRDASFFGHHETYWEGDFDILVEARVVEIYAGTPVMELLACCSGAYQWYSFGTVSGRAQFDEYDTMQSPRMVRTAYAHELEKGFDPEAWNVFELKFRGEEVHAFLNGEKFASEPRSPKHPKGYIGLWVQNAKAEFKRVEAVKR